MASRDPLTVLSALERYPALAHAGGQRIAAVGGFVRDVWLGVEPRELDLVIEGDAAAFARTLGGEVIVHEPFGTAIATGPGWRIDVAMARRERYPEPGALPVVEPASIEEDLLRRDFAVNAIAVTVEGGEVLAHEHALADLDAGRLRVLHDRSFIDDPTRLLRLARYAERLGFEVEPATAALTRAAGFETLSGTRLGAELRLALSEADPAAVLAHVADALPIRLDADLIHDALEIAPPEADRAMLVLGAVAIDDDWLDGLGLSAREREIAAACRRARAPVDATPSALWNAWHAVPVEAVALAGARDDRKAARRWIGELRAVELEIGGDDLIAAGLDEGPEIGRRLRRTLARKLDGEIAGGRETELADALGGEE